MNYKKIMMVLLVLSLPLITWAFDPEFIQSPGFDGWDGATNLPGTNWNVDKLKKMYTEWRRWVKVSDNTGGGGYIRKFKIPNQGEARHLESKDVKGLNIANVETSRGGSAALHYTSSTIEGAEYKAKYAFDGDMSTRWASNDPAAHGPEYLTVDLGADYDLQKIVLKWEAAYANEYAIQTSNDGITFSPMFYTSNGDGGIDDLDIGGHHARFLRLKCISKATPYGYSLYEFEVYSDLSSLAQTAGASYSAKTEEHELPGLYAWKAFDNDFETRWGSVQYSGDDQWLQVDFPSPQTINRVTLYWEAAYGAEYKLLANNGGIWMTLAHITGGDGNIDAIDFNSVTTDKLRLVGVSRGTEYGYSLYEMKVFQAARAQTLEEGCIVQMSPNGKKEESSYSCSTSEAMGYGMILAVLANDKEVFTGLWNVVNAYPAWHDDNTLLKGSDNTSLLTSWNIPSEKDESNPITYKNEEGDMVTEYWPLTDADDVIVGAESNTTNNFWAATDGELDIAYALFLAYSRWKDIKYRDAGYARKAAIDKYLVGTAGNGDKFINTGNCFGTFNNKPKYDNTTAKNLCKIHFTRPCDWVLANFNEFMRLGIHEDTKKAKNNTYSFIDELKKLGTYLLPDFAEFEGTEGITRIEVGEVLENELGDRNYSWNSCRIPWRISQNYYFYQDQRSKQVCYEIVNTLKTDLASDDGIFAGYNSETGIALTGITYTSPAFTVPVILAAQTLKGTDLEYTPVALDALWKKFVIDKHCFLTDTNIQWYTGGDYTSWEKKNLDWGFNIPSMSAYFQDTITLISGTISLGYFYPHEVWEEKIKNVDFEDESTADWFIKSGDSGSIVSRDIDGDGDDELVLTCNEDGDITLETMSKNLEAAASGFGLSFVITKATKANLVWQTDLDWNVKEFDGATGTSLTFKLGAKDAEPGNAESRTTTDNNIMRLKDDVGFEGQGEGPQKLSITFKDVSIGDIFAIDNVRLQDPPETINRWVNPPEWKAQRGYGYGEIVRRDGVTYRCIQGYPPSSYSGAVLPTRANDIYWEENDYGEIGSRWESGTYYNEGSYVYQDGTTYRCLDDHTSYTSPGEDSYHWTYYFSPEDEGVYSSGQGSSYPEWAYSEYYIVGDRVIYDGTAYECTYEHSAQSGTEPDNPVAWAIWEEL